MLDSLPKGTSRGRMEFFALFSLLLVLVLGIWLSSGTLAPYAASHHTPLVEPTCNYLLNIDHSHFFGPIRFLNGAPADEWQHSVVMRRLLYPLLALPLVQVLGFELGGFVTNIVLHLIVIGWYVRFLERRYGRRTAIWIGALLVTYPGIMYWAGLPYSYAAIVPCALIALVLLRHLDESSGTGKMLACCLGIGVLSLAYDLLPYFGSAAILLLVIKRRLLLVPPAIALLVLPTVAVLFLFRYGYQVSMSNSNSEIYGIIISSYLHPSSLRAWWEEIVKIPGIFAHVFFYSNFVFLPTLFLAVLGLSLWRRRFVLDRVETVVAFSVLALFLFMNSAPPYESVWQMRGTWIARIYQPVFVVFISFLARYLHSVNRRDNEYRIAVGLFVLAILGNSLIVFGPATGRARLASYAYYNFYMHSHELALVDNIQRYGSRPYGFCRTRLETSESSVQ